MDTAERLAVLETRLGNLESQQLPQLDARSRESQRDVADIKLKFAVLATVAAIFGLGGASGALVIKSAYGRLTDLDRQVTSVSAAIAGSTQMFDSLREGMKDSLRSFATSLPDTILTSIRGHLAGGPITPGGGCEVRGASQICWGDNTYPKAPDRTFTDFSVRFASRFASPPVVTVAAYAVGTAGYGYAVYHVTATATTFSASAVEIRERPEASPVRVAYVALGAAP
jgi:hypothetical protein